MRIYRQRDDYRSLLRKTQKLFPTLLAHVDTKRIFLCCSEAKKSKYVARIHPNRPPFALISQDYDYSVETWANRFDSLSDAWQVYVMLHELLHVPVEGFDNQSKSYRKTVKHDIEDFMLMRSIYGLKHENVDAVLKGEKFMFKMGPKRFPRIARVK
jgi:predicted metallopeptidase